MSSRSSSRRSGGKPHGTFTRPGTPKITVTKPASSTLNPRAKSFNIGPSGSSSSTGSPLPVLKPKPYNPGNTSSPLDRPSSRPETPLPAPKARHQFDTTAIPQHESAHQKTPPTPFSNSPNPSYPRSETPLSTSALRYRATEAGLRGDGSSRLDPEAPTFPGTSYRSSSRTRPPLIASTPPRAPSGSPPSGSTTQGPPRRITFGGHSPVSTERSYQGDHHTSGGNGSGPPGPTRT